MRPKPDSAFRLWTPSRARRTQAGRLTFGAPDATPPHIATHAESDASTMDRTALRSDGAGADLHHRAPRVAGHWTRPASVPYRKENGLFPAVQRLAQTRLAPARRQPLPVGAGCRGARAREQPRH